MQIISFCYLLVKSMVLDLHPYIPSIKFAMFLKMYINFMFKEQIVVIMHSSVIIY